MAASQPIFTSHVETCVDTIIETVGKKIVFGMPLALGKPNHLANALYLRAKADPSIDLTIITALSLEKPSSSNPLEQRLLNPIVDRIWNGFVEFEYIKDVRANTLPDNVDVYEFFTKAGGYLKSPYAQQHYISTNYTHAVRDLLDNGLNVIGNLIARHPEGGNDTFSMSCNPDLTLEASEKLAKEKKKGKKSLIIGQVNSDLPYMYGGAETGADFYDMILDDPQYDFPLFSVPKASVSPADHMIGLYVSSLVKDGGTIQIGIGSLGDAIAAALIMRQKKNTAYKCTIRKMNILGRYSSLIKTIGGMDTFKKGLYGSTEMLVDVFVHLYDHRILKRQVYDHPGIQELLNQGEITKTITPDMLDLFIDRHIIHQRLTAADLKTLQYYGVIKKGISLDNKTLLHKDLPYSNDLADPKTRQMLNSNLGRRLKNGVVCHGSFFIGPRAFYDALKQMPEKERRLFSMTGVNFVNQLYGDEKLKTLQRKDGRFVNAGMMVTLLGAVVSDGLENGNIVSGVGGQYNFVSMAHALEDGRLIMMIRATKKSNGKLSSNIVFNYGHTTIPRHLRDIVVTEYGIADLRGKCDQDVIKALLNISDSRFQDRLLEQAKTAGKIPADYQVPEEYRHNTPEKFERALQEFKKEGYFQDFPFGTDYTREEITLANALKKLKAQAVNHRFKTVAGVARYMLKSPPKAFIPFLKRMKLEFPGCLKDRLLRAAVVYALDNRR